MARHYGLAFKLDLAPGKIFRNRMGFLEVPGLARQLHVLFAIRGAVVCHRKTQTRRGADGVLVAQPDGIVVAVDLCRPQAGFSVYLRVHLYLDSVYSELDHWLPAQTGPSTVRQLPGSLCP